MPKIPRKSFRRSPPAPAERRAIRGEETWLTGPTRSGSYVTPETAPTIACVYAAIIVLASDLGTMPFNVMKRSANGARSVDWKSDLQDLIYTGPNEEMSSQTHRECKMWHCLTRGNGYDRIHRDRFDAPARLELLDPTKVRPDRTAAGELFYRVAEEAVPASDIIHVRAPGYNGINGKSPIQQAQESFGLTEAVEAFGQAFFGNGISPGGTIEYPEDVDPEAVDQIRQDVSDRHQGADNAHKFLILANGGKFTPTSIPPEQAQFLLTRRFQLEEVCRIFRIPPSKLQSFDKPSYSMLEETNMDYYTSSLLPWITRFEKEWTRKLLTKEQRKVWTIEHDQTHLLKGRMTDQANVFKILRELGVLSSNQIAAFYGWAPHDGGDAHLVQLNQAPLPALAKATLAELKGVKTDPKPAPDDRSGLVDAAIRDLAGDE